MGKRAKKLKKPKRVKLSKTERFVKKGTKKLFILLAIFLFSFMPLNIAFSFKVSISLGLYFLIIYITALSIAMFIGFGVCNSLFQYKAWDSMNIKSSLLTWLGRAVFLIILIIDLKIYVFPMTLDVPRLVTGQYKKINGTVKYIETNDYAIRTGSGRGKWYEKIKYIYFTEQISGETIKITFHANANKSYMGYNIKTIYYLPYTKWGIRAE